MVLSLDGKPMDNGRQLQVICTGTWGVTSSPSRFCAPGGRTTLRSPSVSAATCVACRTRWTPREHMVPRLGIVVLNLTDSIRHILSTVRVATGIVVAPTVPGATDSRDEGFAPGFGRRQFAPREVVTPHDQQRHDRLQREDGGPIAKRAGQHPEMDVAQGVEPRFDPAGKSALAVPRSEQLRVHHRRQRQRDHTGHDPGAGAVESEGERGTGAPVSSCSV